MTEKQQKEIVDIIIKNIDTDIFYSLLSKVGDEISKSITVSREEVKKVLLVDKDSSNITLVPYEEIINDIEDDIKGDTIINILSTFCQERLDSRMEYIP